MDKKLYLIDGKEFELGVMVDFFVDWVECFLICLIEDGCVEDDWEGWKLLIDKVGEKV